MSQIQDWINEARRDGVDISTHVAVKAWGTANVTTRSKAKALVFGALYGGNPRAPKSSHRDEFPNELPSVPHGVHDDCLVMDMPTTIDSWALPNCQQGLDRINRLREFKVKVFTDADITPNYSLYTVMATSEIDARSIAFLLDGGCEPGLADFDTGHIELVKTWTEVVK